MNNFYNIIFFTHYVNNYIVVLQTKYMVPEEGKKWVLKAIGECWKGHKHKVKKNHFDKYETDAERRQNRPETISEDVFMDLLKYWNLERVKGLLYLYNTIHIICDFHISSLSDLILNINIFHCRN